LLFAMTFPKRSFVGRVHYSAHHLAVVLLP
jgi:hypothetical protein